jgi:hypothetical protein
MKKAANAEHPSGVLGQVSTVFQAKSQQDRLVILRSNRFRERVVEPPVAAHEVLGVKANASGDEIKAPTGSRSSRIILIGSGDTGGGDRAGRRRANLAIEHRQ